MARKRDAGLPTMLMVINVVGGRGKKEGQWNSTSRMVTRKVKLVSKMD